MRTQAIMKKSIQWNMPNNKLYVITSTCNTSCDIISCLLALLFLSMVVNNINILPHVSLFSLIVLHIKLEYSCNQSLNESVFLCLQIPHLRMIWHFFIFPTDLLWVNGWGGVYGLFVCLVCLYLRKIFVLVRKTCRLVIINTTLQYKA